MKNIIDKRNWWIILVVVGILSVGVTLIQQKWLPDFELAAFLFVTVLLGIAFYWVYIIQAISKPNYSGDIQPSQKLNLH